MKIYKVQAAVGVVSLALLAGCSTNKPMQTESAQDSKSMQTEAMEDYSRSSKSSSNNMQNESMQDAVQSERLGTKWGDEVDSVVTTVDLRRISNQPIEQMQINYADKNYNGRTINSISLAAGKIDFSVTSDYDNLPIYRSAGNYYLQGQAGQAYRLVYTNNSPNTYEIVASVDGLNVIDGSAASRSASGYVLSPYDDLVIEGFRKSDSAVASFIFSKPQSAYAANTSQGSINNTGVIGTVVYGLYDPSKPRSSQPQAFPADNGYAQPPK